MKKETVLYIVIAILLVVVSCGTTYIIMEGKYKDDNPKTNIQEPNSKDSETEYRNEVKLKETKKDGDKIVQNFTIDINGKSHLMKLEFNNTNADSWQTVKGLYKNIELYSYESDANMNFNEEAIKSVMNEKNFGFIKGTDNKFYLYVLATNTYPAGDQNIFMYIFNDELEMIQGNMKYQTPGKYRTFAVNNGQTLYYVGEKEEHKTYTDTFGICDGKEYCDNILKIVDNKIYYYEVIDFQIADKTTGTLEERVYTVGNNKLEYTTINKYNIVSIVGAVE